MFGSNLEAAQSACKDMAKVCKVYFDSLIEEGFTEEQALHLVAEWQHAILGGGVKGE